MTELAQIPIAQWEDQFQLSFTLPENAAYFDGHFPGDPLVPAAQLLAWLQEMLARIDPHFVQNGRIERAKFLAPVRPGALLTLECSPTAEGWSVLARTGETIALRAVFYPDAS